MNKIKVGKSIKSLPDLTLAKQNIPQWYKNIPGVNEKNLTFSENNQPVLNVKSCMPFFDSLSSGYIINLWCDLYFEPLEDGSHYVRWGDASPNPLNFRDHNQNIIPTPWGHSPYHYAWRVPYALSLPSGYSALITHPFNRSDLPFTSLSGIIDADPLMMGGNYPFFIKDRFSGVIPQGTPILQILPFKRESWRIENSEKVAEMAKEYLEKNKRKFFGFYKNNVWKKKQYE